MHCALYFLKIECFIEFVKFKSIPIFTKNNEISEKVV